MELFMIILAGVTGALIGWVVNWASGYLPRFSASHTTPPTLQHQPRDNWLALHTATILLSVLGFAYFWARFDLSWELVVYSGVYAFFLLIALIDLKYRLVLNIITYPATVLILLAQGILLRQDLGTVLLGGVFTFAIFFLAAWLGDLGSGDIKLAVLIGVAFGFPQMFWALIVGGGIGSIVAVILLLRHHKDGIPYAPFLCLGAMIALLYNPILFTI